MAQTEWCRRVWCGVVACGVAWPHCGPTRCGCAGGVCRSTADALEVLGAAGFSVAMVETVGVGQSETAVAGLVDCVVLVRREGRRHGQEGRHSMHAAWHSAVARSVDMWAASKCCRCHAMPWRMRAGPAASGWRRAADDQARHHGGGRSASCMEVQGLFGMRACGRRAGLGRAMASSNRHATARH